MVGLFGFLAGGAAAGYGTSVKEQAVAKREAALRQFEADREMAFRREEAATARDFESKEAEKARQFELDNRPGPSPTDDMREYDMAVKQGYEGSLTDWKIEQKRAGAARTNIDTGTIPTGMRAVRDQDGNISHYEAIPGSPAAAEGEATAEATANRKDAEKDRSGLIAEEIDRTMTKMDEGMLPNTGVGAWLADVPGTNAKAVASLLTTIKANIGFAELSKMRQQSPTGGALGNVTEKEIAYLQSVAGNLDQSQSAEDLRYNLNRLWNSYMDVIHGEGNGPERRALDWSPSSQKGKKQAAGPRVGDVEEGYRFKGGNPGDSKAWESVR